MSIRRSFFMLGKHTSSRDLLGPDIVRIKLHVQLETIHIENRCFLVEIYCLITCISKIGTMYRYSNRRLAREKQFEPAGLSYIAKIAAEASTVFVVQRTAARGSVSRCSRPGRFCTL